MSVCKLYTILLHYLALNCGHHHQHSQPAPHHHHLPRWQVTHLYQWFHLKTTSQASPFHILVPPVYHPWQCPLSLWLHNFPSLSFRLCPILTILHISCRCHNLPAWGIPLAAYPLPWQQSQTRSCTLLPLSSKCHSHPAKKKTCWWQLCSWSPNLQATSVLFLSRKSQMSLHCFQLVLVPPFHLWWPLPASLQK